MRPIYLECAELTGKFSRYLNLNPHLNRCLHPIAGRGSYQKRKVLIREAIEKPDMLFTYRQTADQEYTEAVTRHIGTLSKTVQAQIEGLANDLAPIIDKTKVPKRKNVPDLIEKLKVKVEDAQKILDAAQQALSNVL